MKIGVISDTHGLVPAWEKAMAKFADADLIIHAGDVLYHPPRVGIAEGYDVPGLVELINTCPVPIVIARGNCDADVYEELLDIPVLSPYATVQFGGLTIVAHHGHTLSRDQVQRLAEKFRANVFITGHTHIPVIEKLESGAILLNPGSPSLPKFERSGVLTPTIGLIDEHTVRVIELDSGEEVFSMSLM